MDKAEIRKEIRNKKRQFTQAQLGELSLSVINRLKAHPRVKDAHTLLLYYSLPDEVNTHEWIDELVKEGKKVLLPVVIDDENMILREYSDRKDLAIGSFHIMEPIGKLFPEERYGEIETGIIPGMGFDEDRHRLGRGKGYYDRFLEKQKNISERCGAKALYKIGVSFKFQKVRLIPTDIHDIPMDEVITSD